MTFVKNIKATFGKDAVIASEADRGDLVQTVLITAGFAVAAILVVAWISQTVAAKGAEISNCIGNAGQYDKGKSVTECEDNTRSKDAADKSNDEYGNRFGS